MMFPTRCFTVGRARTAPASRLPCCWSYSESTITTSEPSTSYPWLMPIADGKSEASTEVSDPVVALDSSQALLLLSELARLRPEEEYFRVSHAETGTVAYADYELGVGLWHDPETDEELEFKPPDASIHAWGAAVERLLALAA